MSSQTEVWGTVQQAIHCEEIDRCLLEVKRNLHLRNCDLDVAFNTREDQMGKRNVKQNQVKGNEELRKTEENYGKVMC